MDFGNDVEEETFDLEVDRVQDVLAAHAKVRAIISVHLFGACADMDPIMEMAAELEGPVIEDAAQSIGSEYKGRRAGSMGQIGCFSFFASKNLGGYGDGGIVTTNDDILAERLRALHVHGSKRKYYHEWVGVNSRLDALQAAVLRLQPGALVEASAPVVAMKPVPYRTRHIYNQFVIRGATRYRRG